MNKISLVSIIASILFLGSCNKTVPSCINCDFNCISEFTDQVITTNNCLDDYECLFELETDTKMDFSTNSGKTASDNHFVIQLTYSTEGSAQIADDEFTNHVAIEIPNETTSFSLNDSELGNLSVAYKRICFCPYVDWKLFSDGCLQGEKIDGTWFLQGSLEIDYYDNDSPFEIEFDFEVQ